jgi:hypothetical protein
MEIDLIVVQSRETITPWGTNGLEFSYNGQKVGTVIGKKKISNKKGTTYYIQICKGFIEGDEWVVDSHRIRFRGLTEEEKEEFAKAQSVQTIIVNSGEKFRVIVRQSNGEVVHEMALF